MKSNNQKEKIFELKIDPQNFNVKSSESLQLLASQLSGVSNLEFTASDLEQLSRLGRINIHARGVVQVRIDLSELKKRSKKVSVEEKINLNRNDILFEDDILIVVDKPNGTSSQPGLDPSKDSMVSALSRYIFGRDGRLGYLALHHRLDFETSGVLLFCRKKSFNKSFSDLFSSREIKKEYMALVSGIVESDQFRVHNKLDRAYDRPLRSVVVSEGGQVALTDFRVHSRSNDKTLIHCLLGTGRLHQIRVHLAFQGHPIMGDQLYGGPHYERLMLHAQKLSFNHPKTGEQLSVESPVPKIFNS